MNSPLSSPYSRRRFKYSQNRVYLITLPQDSVHSNRSDTALAWGLRGPDTCLKRVRRLVQLFWKSSSLKKVSKRKCTPTHISPSRDGVSTLTFIYLSLNNSRNM